eukprot:g12787.t1
MGVSASAPAPTGLQGSHLEGSRVRVAVKERYYAYLPDFINRHASLSEEKIRLVAHHWNFIVDEDDTGMQDAGLGPTRISVFYDAFYQKLFEKAPEAKNLFDGNMVRQSRALVKMVSWLCNIEVTDDLVGRLEALADRHVEYGCLPVHYEAGGDALQYALRATLEDQDPEEAKLVMKAWKDVYSFVILVVVPRTALRLEESVRSAGPVTTMLRPTPISGTRLKVLAKTPPPRINNARSWQHRPAPRGDHHASGGGPSRASSGAGGSRRPTAETSRQSSLGTPNTAAATPDAAGEDHAEWFGTCGRPPDAARTGSASSLGRTSSGRRRRRRGGARSGTHRLSDTLPARTSGERERSRFDILGAPWSGAGGGGGGGHNLAAPYADGAEGEDGMYTPGDSPLSVASSLASGLHLSLGSVATTTGVNSAWVSPAGSALGAVGKGAAQATGERGGKGEGRKSKLLRGLGKLSGAKGGADDSSSVRISSSSPRGPTIGARARAVLSGRQRRYTENANTGQHRGAARHSRSHSVGTATAIAAEAVSRRGTDGGWGQGGGAPFSGEGGEASGFQQQHLYPERRGMGNGSNINGGGPPVLASPAGSTLSLPSSRSSWEMPGALTGRSRGGGDGGAAGVVVVSSKKRPTRVAVAPTPTAQTPTSVTLARPDYGWLEGNKVAAAGDIAQGRDERTPRPCRMSPAGIRDAAFGSNDSGAGDNGGNGRATVTASMESPSRRLASVSPGGGTQQSVLLPSSSSRPRTENTAASSHRPYGGGGGRDSGGGEPDRRHRATPPRVPEHRRSSSGGRERAREQGVCAGEDGSFEEPMPVTPEFDGGLSARVPRSPPSAAESRSGSRRLARRESGSRSMASRRRRAENAAREKIRPTRSERKAELVDQAGVFGDDDVLDDKPGGEMRRPATAEAERGTGAGGSKISREAAAVLPPLDDSEGNAGGATAASAGYRLNSGERATGSDAVFDSFGANALVFFQKTLGVDNGDRGDGGCVGGTAGRKGGADGNRGALEGRAADEASVAEEKKEEFGEARMPPRRTPQRSQGSSRHQHARQQQHQRPQRMEQFPQQGRAGTGSSIKAATKRAETGQGRKGEEKANSGLFVLSAAPAPVVSATTNQHSRRYSPSVYADHPQSPTPEELAAVQAGAFSGHHSVWQDTEAIVTTPSPRGRPSGTAASSPPHCPSPFFAARRSSPFARSRPRARVNLGGSSNDDGWRGAGSSKADPSSTWCATTGAAETATAVATAAGATAAASGGVSAAPSKTLSPPMWKPSRPIVPGQAPAPSAAASVLQAFYTPPASPPRGASVRASGVDAVAAAWPGLGGDPDGGEHPAMVERNGVRLGGAVGSAVTAAPAEGRSAAEQRYHHHHQQQQQQGLLRQEQLGLVRKSENTPMSLPQMDDSGHAPEADDFGVMVPAAGARKARKHRVVPPSVALRKGDDPPGDGVEDPELRQAIAAAATAAGHASPKAIWMEGGAHEEVKGSCRDAGDGQGLGGGRTEVAAAGAMQGSGEAPRAVALAAAAAVAATGVLGGGLGYGRVPDSFGVPIVGGKSPVAGNGHGSVIAVGTVSAASERWGGGRTTAPTKAPAALEMERREAAAAAAPAAALAEEERAIAAESAAPAAPAAAPAPAAVWGGRERDLPSELGRVNGTVKALESVAVKRRGSTGGAVESSSVPGTGKDYHHLRSAKPSVTADTTISTGGAVAGGAPRATPGGSRGRTGSTGSSSKPNKGRVAAMAASFARNWGRGGDTTVAVGGAGAVQAAGGDGVSSGGSAAGRAGRGRAAGAPTSAPASEGRRGAGEGGDAHAKYGVDRVEERERRKGLMDGLAFGNVRQKANAWGVPLKELSF